MRGSGQKQVHGTQQSLLQGHRCKGLKATPASPARGICNKILEVRSLVRSSNPEESSKITTGSPKRQRSGGGREHCTVRKGLAEKMMLGEPDPKPGRLAPAEMGDDETLSLGHKH